MKYPLNSLQTVSILLAAGLVSFCFSSKANAFGGYADVEHPFAYIGSGISQGEGDAQCRQLHYNMKNESYSANAGTDGFGVNWRGSVVTAFDGVAITHPWHVWYHQVNGECVANK
jgi:hypothetical protein